MKFPLKRVYNFSHMAAHQKLACDPSCLPTLSPNIQTFCKLLLGQLPVGFPDVDGLGVCDVVLQSLLIQQVEKVFDCQRYGTTGAEDRSE